MTPARLEAERVNGYLVFLFLLLSTATLFEGFDAAMLTFAAPDARATLDISREQWGFVFAATRLGMIASFFFLLSADRFGRRSLLMVTVVGFTVFNGLTAFATDKWEFTVYQFFARLFLTAEYALAIIVIGEEYPARLRGRAIAILTSLATVGVMVMAKLQPYVLLEPGAEGNWLHDGGAAVVAFGQGLLGQPQDGASWRVLYAIGAVPLLLILVLRLALRETRRFEASRKAAAPAPQGTRRERWRRHLEDAMTPWRPEYRRRTLLVALLWNCVHLVTAPSVAYWVIFVREDLGFTPAQAGDIVFWGYAGGVAGHFVAGWLIERIGRRWTCSVFYVGAAISICMLYQIHSVAGQYLWMILTVFCFGAGMTATHVYASELFPTEIRATGYGWTTNLVGRATEIVTPTAIALLIAPLGLPAAIAIVAIGPILGAALVMRYAPETAGLTLEEVQQHLAAQATGKQAGGGGRRAASRRRAELGG